MAESIKTLRSFGGNLAIVTQTIPALDEIYGENTRRSLQGGAGVKLYLTPSEQKTIEELSQAVGKTTKELQDEIMEKFGPQLRQKDVLVMRQTISPT